MSALGLCGACNAPAVITDELGRRRFCVNHARFDLSHFDELVRERCAGRSQPQQNLAAQLVKIWRGETVPPPVLTAGNVLRGTSMQALREEAVALHGIVKAEPNKRLEGVRVPPAPAEPSVTMTPYERLQIEHQKLQDVNAELRRNFDAAIQRGNTLGDRCGSIHAALDAARRERDEARSALYERERELARLKRSR